MTPAPSNQSPVTSGHVVAYAVVAVVGAMLAALDAGISKGAIPLPQSLTPFLPVIVAGLTILTALLPKVTDGAPTPTPGVPINQAADAPVPNLVTFSPSPLHQAAGLAGTWLSSVGANVNAAASAVPPATSGTYTFSSSAIPSQIAPAVPVAPPAVVIPVAPEPAQSPPPVPVAPATPPA